MIHGTYYIVLQLSSCRVEGRSSSVLRNHAREATQTVAIMRRDCELHRDNIVLLVDSNPESMDPYRVLAFLGHVTFPRQFYHLRITEFT